MLPTWVANSASLHMNDPIYNAKIFPIWTTIGSNLRKIGWFCSKLGQLVNEWVMFFWKNGICVGLPSNSLVACPYQNRTWVPTRPHFDHFTSKLSCPNKCPPSNVQHKAWYCKGMSLLSKLTQETIVILAHFWWHFWMYELNFNLL